MAPNGKNDDGQILGDAVVEKRSNGDESTYFPDPAAAYLAVALRKHGSKKQIGNAATLSLKGFPGKKQLSYPDTLPVILTSLAGTIPREKSITSINKNRMDFHKVLFMQLNSNH